MLISEHRDGELIARIVQRFDYRTIRGSTTRAATRALLTIVRHLDGGGEIAITPDGPRGPACTVAPGALIAAQRAKVPVIAVGVHASRAWRLRSWDAFMIPKPFARVTIAYSDPTDVEAQDARAAARADGAIRAAPERYCRRGARSLPRRNVTVDDIWYADTKAARAMRGERCSPHRSALVSSSPLGNRLYDAGVLHVVPPLVPTISIGNLSVGGTGNTPVAADLVQRLHRLGRTPAIVMRGYGGDETIVHTLLNPGTRVYADADRVAGIVRAAREGADVAVLVDAFQHRRAGRAADIVLLSAERWNGRIRLLPGRPIQRAATSATACISHPRHASSAPRLRWWRARRRCQSRSASRPRDVSMSQSDRTHHARDTG